jgi:hypothetical protein
VARLPLRQHARPLESGPHVRGRIVLADQRDRAVEDLHGALVEQVLRLPAPELPAADDRAQHHAEVHLCQGVVRVLLERFACRLARLADRALGELELGEADVSVQVLGIAVEDALDQRLRALRVLREEEVRCGERSVVALRVEPHRLLVVEERVAVFLEAHRHVGDPVVHVRILRLELQRVAQLEHRLLVLALLHVGIGAREVLRLALGLRLTADRSQSERQGRHERDRCQLRGERVHGFGAPSRRASSARAPSASGNGPLESAFSSASRAASDFPCAASASPRW